MDDVWSIAFLTSVLPPPIPAGTAILYACLGETIAERAGVLNLGVEGMMLMGALGGFAAMNWTGNAWIGWPGRCGGAAMASIHAVLTIGLPGQPGRQRFRPDHLRRRSVGLSWARSLVGGSAAGKVRSRDRDSRAVRYSPVGTILFQQDAPRLHLVHLLVPFMLVLCLPNAPGPQSPRHRRAARSC